jgi:hypothetical protein
MEERDAVIVGARCAGSTLVLTGERLRRWFAEPASPG